MSKLTLDEAIAHAMEVAGEQQERADSAELIDILDGLDVEACKECAADHRQLAEWLTELKQWRRVYGVCPSYEMCIPECREGYDAQIAEYKRLLKAAVEDMSEKNFCAKVCKRDNFACRVSDTCDFKWRYADEALKLLNDEK